MSYYSKEREAELVEICEKQFGFKFPKGTWSEIFFLAGANWNKDKEAGSAENHHEHLMKYLEECYEVPKRKQQ